MLKNIGKALLLVVFVGFIPALTLGSFAFAMLEWRHRNHLLEHGVRVDGTVLARDDRGLVRNRTYELRYSYPDPKTGQVREATEPVDEVLHRWKTPGDSIKVLVDPEDGASVQLARNDHFIESLTKSTIGLLLLLAAVVYFGRMFAAERRAARARTPLPPPSAGSPSRVDGPGDRG